MTVRDILPFIDKDLPFVILDQNGRAQTVEGGNAEMILGGIMDKQVTKITQHKYDMYAEESYTALRVLYDSGVIE